MVCNVVTYRARSAVREVGVALGFPRPLVDRVAKALETYDSVMVRRDLEAEGGFAEFFQAPAGVAAVLAGGDLPAVPTARRPGAPRRRAAAWRARSPRRSTARWRGGGGARGRGAGAHPRARRPPTATTRAARVAERARGRDGVRGRDGRAAPRTRRPAVRGGPLGGRGARGSAGWAGARTSGAGRAAVRERPLAGGRSPCGRDGPAAPPATGAADPGRAAAMDVAHLRPARPAARVARPGHGAAARAPATTRAAPATPRPAPASWPPSTSAARPSSSSPAGASST